MCLMKAAPEMWQGKMLAFKTTVPLVLALEAASCMLISHSPLLFFSFQSSHPLPVPSSSVDSTSGEEWSAWSVCSATCGEGWQSRTRFCVSSSYSTQCSGPLREQRPCNNSAICPGKPLPHFPHIYLLLSPSGRQPLCLPLHHYYKTLLMPLSK